MLTEILLISLSFIIVLSGAVGVILPLLPGVFLSWAGMVLFGYATGFAVISSRLLIVFFLLTLGTLILDALAPLLGAKKYQASSYGVIGSFLGIIFGVMIFGPIGIIIGPFAGVLFGELLFGREPEEAMRSAKGTVIGFLAGSAIKLSVIIAMLGYMIFAIF